MASGPIARPWSLRHYSDSIHGAGDSDALKPVTGFKMSQNQPCARRNYRLLIEVKAGVMVSGIILGCPINA